MAKEEGFAVIGNIGNIADGRKVVAAAGTRETLVAATIPCKRVIIAAETDNTGVITVGDVTVVAAEATRRGIPLSAGDAIEMDIDNLLKIYLDTTINGDGVTFMYST